jgi:hypothetical protein
MGIIAVDTKKTLENSRDEIAFIFNDKYEGNIIMSTIQRPVFSFPTYWLTGFNIKYRGSERFIEVRMQIKENYDEKRRIHFARQLPDNEFKNYFLAKLAFEIKETLKQNDHVSSRHPYLMKHDYDLFQMPDSGFGLITSFDNPSETGKYLITLDNLIDKTIKKPCSDEFVLDLISKRPPTYGEFK